MFSETASQNTPAENIRRIIKNNHPATYGRINLVENEMRILFRHCFTVRQIMAHNHIG